MNSCAFDGFVVDGDGWREFAGKERVGLGRGRDTGLGEDEGGYGGFHDLLEGRDGSEDGGLRECRRKCGRRSGECRRAGCGGRRRGCSQDAIHLACGR